MEDFSIPMNEEDQNFELPPGFRFHPTDEELITHYLSQKVLDSFFSAKAIGEVDLNKCEPWDLPGRAKMGGGKEWYFFCVRDKKYPTGLRTNRATDAGYWKATGKDKEIYKAKTLIGMKKTLVFYKGRAPKGGKTNWVMHEYRLEGEHSMYNLPKTAKSEWSLCRVFEKCEKKVMNFNNLGKELPPLMDSSPYNSETKTNTAGESSHVTCFSDQNQAEEDHHIDSPYYYTASNSINPSSVSVSPASWDFTKLTPNMSLQQQYPSQITANEVGNSSSQCLDYFVTQDQSMLRMLMDENRTSTKHKNEKAEERNFDEEMSSVMYKNEMFQRSLFGNQEYSSSSGSVGIGDSCYSSLWNF